jgi:hypothetical protein
MAVRTFRAGPYHALPRITQHTRQPVSPLNSRRNGAVRGSKSGHFAPMVADAKKPVTPFQKKPWKRLWSGSHHAKPQVAFEWVEIAIAMKE